MPNAKDTVLTGKHKIIVLGDTGHGKTAQFLTLPGKKYAYLFDPNAIRTLQGFDVDYDEFLPDRIPLQVFSLSKDVNKNIKAEQRALASRVYNRWEQDLEGKLDKGFFKSYDWLVMDSFTTFSALVMDEVLRINGRAGMWPQEDDYAPQMNAISKVFRLLTSHNIGVYCTGHHELKEDGLTHRIFRQPLMTGRLRVTLPLLFSDILAAELVTDEKGNAKYTLLTRPTKQIPLIRCSIKGLEPVEDVTIDWKKPVEGQGLGGILSGKGGVAPA